MIAWYIAPYKIKKEPLGATHHNRRYCAMNDYTSVIYGEGGQWSETEILGNRAIVKVRASEATLQILDGIYKRMLKDDVNDSLSSLSAGEIQTQKNEAIDMGYSLAEVEEYYNKGVSTLKDIFKLYTKRRLKPRYDSVTDTIYIDGVVQKCKSIEIVDTKVQ